MTNNCRHYDLSALMRDLDERQLSVVHMLDSADVFKETGSGYTSAHFDVKMLGNTDTNVCFRLYECPEIVLNAAAAERDREPGKKCWESILSKNGRLLIQHIRNRQQTDVTDGVEEAADCAFFWSHHLHSVSMPASVRCAGKEAFKGCRNLGIIFTGSLWLLSFGPECFAHTAPQFCSENTAGSEKDAPPYFVHAEAVR